MKMARNTAVVEKLPIERGEGVLCRERIQQLTEIFVRVKTRLDLVYEMLRN